MSAAFLLEQSNSQQPPALPAKKIIINSIYNDLDFLQNQVGRFRVFGKFDPEHWVSCFETVLRERYSNIDEVCSHFHFFVDPEQFSAWYFGQTATTWVDLRKGFLEKASEIELELRELAIMKQTDFVEKVKKLRKDDNKLLTEFTNYPITTFIRVKLQLLLLVYPKMPRAHYLQMAISMLDDKTRIKRFHLKVGRKADVATLLTYAKYEDSSGA